MESKTFDEYFNFEICQKKAHYIIKEINELNLDLTNVEISQTCTYPIQDRDDLIVIISASVRNRKEYQKEQEEEDENEW